MLTLNIYNRAKQIYQKKNKKKKKKIIRTDALQISVVVV